MLKTRSSEGSRFTFDIAEEIQRKLTEELTGIASTFPNSNFSFKPSECRLCGMKPRDVVSPEAVMSLTIEYCEDLYFENRKRRPQDRGRKKRRKGEWNPIDRLWNSMISKTCSVEHLLGQD